MVLRIALTDGGGGGNPKWEVGTVLESYPDDWEFCWGDEARFFLIKVADGSLTADEIRRRKKKIDLDLILSAASKARYVANRDKDRATYLATGELPKLGIVVDVATVGMLNATPKAQWVEDPIP